MDLSRLSSTAPVRMKAFPPGRLGVLLPLDDRRTAALGMCLYTTSKPWVIVLQKAAHRLVSLAGARALPGRTEPWTPPCTDDEWRSLVAAWHETLGPFDGLTCYRRHQQARSGLMLLLTQQGKALAFVKIRLERDGGLEVEQAALAAMARIQPRTFRAPRPLGAGEVGDLRWSAQEAVFSAPHQPVLDAAPELFDEVSASLLDLVPTPIRVPDHLEHPDHLELPERALHAERALHPDQPAGAAAAGTRLDHPLHPNQLDHLMHPDRPQPETVAAHGDLTVWNLRRDASGQIWLYDWEDVGSAPKDSDRAYYCATSRSLGGPAMPADLSAEALEHARAVVHERNRSHPENAALKRSLLDALDEADNARTARSSRTA